MEGPSSFRGIRFGPFEVDRATGELRKQGRRIRLQEQPFQVLAALLEKPGELVTREELRQHIWSDDTFVDFDHGLNKAINKLRQVLGDASSNPRYVETLPRRGYRFIARVESVGGQHAVPEGPIDQKQLDGSAPAEPDQPPRTSSWTPGATIVAGVALLGAALGATWWLIRPPAEEPVPAHKLTPLTFDSGLTYQPSISPDGKFVAFASDRARRRNLDLWILQIGGGEPVPLTSDPADEYEPSFSPDGTRIAFRSDRNGGGIYVVPALGGAPPRPIADGGHWPKFSPNGALIAYRDGNRNHGRQIFVVPSEGGKPRTLGPNWDEFRWQPHRILKHPIWSPDGRYLLYDNNLDWVVVSVQGGPATATGAKTVLERQGLKLRQSTPEAWRADDHSIVFSSRADEGQTNLWQIPVSRNRWEVQGPAEPLTSTTESAVQASVAAKGRTVFTSLVENSDLWSLPIDADEGKVLGELEQITHDVQWEDFLSISTDGRKLVYGVDRYRRPFTFSGSRDIQMLNLAAGRSAPLADSTSPELAAVISPDGSRVVYMVLEGDQFALHIISTDSRVSEKILSNAAEPTGWTADGRSILYKWKQEGRLLDLTSGKSVTLLTHPDLSMWPGYVHSNGWTGFTGQHPDGNWRIFIAPFLGGREIPESEWVALTDGSAADTLPRLSPDGNLLYFLSDRDGYRCIWMQRLDPATKHPVGEAINLYHFHEPWLTSSNRFAPTWTGLALARDRIVVALDEIRGNIWTMGP